MGTKDNIINFTMNKILSSIIIIGNETTPKQSLSANLNILEKGICAHFGECILQSGLKKHVQNGKQITEVCYIRSFIHEDTNANYIIIKALAQEIRSKLDQEKILVLIGGEPHYFS